MNKFAAVIEYDGTDYYGFQLQKDVPTIQGAVETALEKILGKPTRVYGAGRTDSGVHAKGQVAHFFADWSHEVPDLRRACNAVLPPDVILRRLEQAADDFDARHSALLKTYRYRVLNEKTRSPLKRLYSWHVSSPLDIVNMNAAAGRLLGTHDFAAFGSPTGGTPLTIREMKKAQWDGAGSDRTICFTITGTGFLKYMVRSIVGTLVFVGKGKISVERFVEILNSRDRSQAGPTAPPHGLCLMSVDYGKK